MKVNQLLEAVSEKEYARQNMLKICPQYDEVAKIFNAQNYGNIHGPFIAFNVKTAAAVNTDDTLKKLGEIFSGWQKSESKNSTGNPQVILKKGKKAFVVTLSDKMRIKYGSYFSDYPAEMKARAESERLRVKAKVDK